VALHLYIYYRVAGAADRIAADAADDVIERVRHATGVAGRRLVRRDEPDLWMEIYEGIADAGAFTTALDAAVVASGLPTRLAPGERRHVEWFRDPSPCA
jgi:hypothetical protein